jgi:amino-acid N-acetyltransferase
VVLASASSANVPVRRREAFRHHGVVVALVNDATVDLELATGDALADVEALLAVNDLPADDVRDDNGAFYVAYDEGDAVGIGSLEVYGSTALLRSLVVRESVRGEGYGGAVCDALEREAREDGVDETWLLTTTASEFFAVRGYDEVPRESAPDAVRATEQFADVCPDSATCMRKSL